MVFTLVLFIYLFCVFFTLTSFSEMPLSTLEETASKVRRFILNHGVNVYSMQIWIHTMDVIVNAI